MKLTDTMEIDTNISDILLEVIAFLECLHDVQLSFTLDNLREKLLVRSKNILTTMTRALSPEPYLDMNSGPKSLLLTNSTTDSQEYIGIEESQKQIHQDYYETFVNEDQTNVAAAPKKNETEEKKNDIQDKGETLIGIYKNLTAAQIKNKCHKCGPLYRKEGKKLFLSENRSCWIALVGSHLLIYRSERHDRPYAIYPIRGYMARPAPNLIPRDRQKSESAFEIYSPGNETLGFIARTPKEMHQWIAKICEIDFSDKSEKNKVEDCKKRRATIESSINYRKDNETTQHIGRSTMVDESNGQVELTNNKNEVEPKGTSILAVGSPPPLPARIPRRLPSLPPDNAISLYKAIAEDDDDDDDIYHKIEDLRNGTCYQNMVISKKYQADAIYKGHETIIYDDVPNERNEKQVQEKKCDTPFEEAHDIITFLRTEKNITSIEQENNIICRSDDRSIANSIKEKHEEFYDDVGNLIPNERFVNDRARDQIEMSSKCTQKKSFLDRVLSRKESPSKSDKKNKGKVSSSLSPSSATEEMPTYDDVFDLMPNKELLADKEEELPEYNCPPPPRPICAKSPIVSNPNQIEEFYDDIGTCREQYNKNYQQIVLESTQESKVKEINNMANNTEFGINDDVSEKEIEHYQSPKSDLCVVTDGQQKEELYDDIALWTDFTARQRDITGKKDDENAKSMISSDKKSWNRFAVNRKSRASDFNYSTETNKQSGNEGEEIENLPENNSIAKRNTFQKLITRMENSLAKVSVRSPPSIPTGKSSIMSNNS